MRNQTIRDKIKNYQSSLNDNLDSLISPLSGIGKDIKKTYKDFLKKESNGKKLDNISKNLKSLENKQEKQTETIDNNLQETNEILNDINKNQTDLYKSNSVLVKQIINSNKSFQNIGDSLESTVVKSFESFQNNNMRTFDSLEEQRKSFDNFQKQLSNNFKNDNDILKELLNINSRDLDFSQESQTRLSQIFDSIRADLNSEKANTSLVNISSTLDVMNSRDDRTAETLNAIRLSAELEKRNKSKEKNDKSGFDLSKLSNLAPILNGLGSLMGIGGLGSAIPLLFNGSKALFGYIKMLPKITTELFSKLSSLTSETLSLIGKGAEWAKNAGSKSLELGKNLLSKSGALITDGLNFAKGLANKGWNGLKSVGSKTGNFLKGAGGKALGLGTIGVSGSYGMATGIENTEKIMGKESKEFGNLDIVNAMGVGGLTSIINTASLGTANLDPSKVQNKIEKGFDYIFSPELPTSATNNKVSSSAMNLANIAQNRNVTKRGVKRGSIQNILKGAGRCYENVWGDIVQSGLNKKGLAPTGGTHGQNHATDFAEWAETNGKNVVSRVGVNPDDKRLGLLPGDIIVLKAGWYAGNEAGHIEIVGKDGSGYSDFKDTDLRIVKASLDKIMGVYRLKDKSQKIANNNEQTKVKNNVKINSLPDTIKAYKNLGLKEMDIGANFKASKKNNTISKVKSNIKSNNKQIKSDKVKSIIKPLSIPMNQPSLSYGIEQNLPIPNESNINDIIESADKEKSKVESFIDNTINQIPSIKETILNSIDSIPNIRSYFDNIIKILPDNIQNILNNQEQSLMDLKKYLPKNFEDSIPKDLVDNVSNIFSKGNEIYNSIPDFIKNNIPKSLDNLPEFGTNLVSKIFSAMDNPATLLDNVPDLVNSPIFSGFIDTMKNSIIPIIENPMQLALNSSPQASIQRIDNINPSRELTDEILKQNPYINNNQSVSSKPQAPVIVQAPAQKTSLQKSYNIEDMKLAIITSGVLD